MATLDDIDHGVNIAIKVLSFTGAVIVAWCKLRPEDRTVACVYSNCLSAFQDLLLSFFFLLSILILWKSY